MQQPTGNKRKKKILSLEQKLQHIAKFEKGTSVCNLALEYMIGKQTVRDIVKQKSSLEAFVRDCDSSAGPSQRKTMKHSINQQLDTAVLTWFNQKRAEGILISGPILTEKAKFFHEGMGNQADFKASSGWLRRFKNRYGIRMMST